ncbi:uncharacterized protein BO97DRAFT_458229 [Aspergillus homomorphus CBS 101889]|uniref:DUF6604 domain-containing protein n=1 Tax=Aspergillus homomorphus (strain CBS 101889) TaxID=1450537 RepID=A0A395HN87_ASPHC|nr:hypothetical protein BO97DRAFT_458229 [Aspergillus homomorphus CBS 101889]RAL09412.1 hypothetical protein BO97DRAFT_458229 [Aspergillus homomorphus CBS 101889]
MAAAQGAEPPKCFVTSNEYAELADRIAASGAAIVQVPRKLITRLEGAIECRRKHGQKIQGADQGSDQRHQQLMATEPAAAPDERFTAQEKNQFEGLEVHEPSESFLNAPDAPRPAPEVRYEAEPPRTLADAKFALRLILEDIGAMHRFVAAQWGYYRRNATRIEAVVLASETAVSLVSQLVAEAEEIFQPFHGSVHDLCEARFPVEDAFSRELRSAMKVRKVSIPLLAAATLFYQTRCAMGVDVHKAFDELQAEMEKIRKDVERVIECHSEDIQWVILTPLLSALNQVECDILSQERNDYDGMDGFEGEETPAFQLLKIHPQFSGLLLCEFKRLAQIIILEFVNQSMAVLGICHLYNAGQKEGLLDGNLWPDVPLTMIFHPNVIGSGQTNTRDDFYRSFKFAIGMSAVQATLSERSSRKTGRLSKAYEFQPHAEVTCMLTERCTTPERPRWTAKEVEHILSESRFSESDGGLIDHFSGLCVGTLARDKKPAARSSGRPTNTEFLHLLSRHVKAEQLEFKIPWLTLHVVAWKVLTRFRDAYSEDLKLLKARYFPYGKLHPCCVPHLIFADGSPLAQAGNRDRLHPLPGEAEILKTRENKGQISEDTLLAKLITILKTVVREKNLEGMSEFEGHVGLGSLDGQSVRTILPRLIYRGE